MRIEKPGPYRTATNLKAEVMEIRGEYAIGWINSDKTARPAAWLVADSTIRSGWNNDRIVEEWRVPATETVTLQLCISDAGIPFVRLGNHPGIATVIAQKTVTITEGEGMQ